MSRFLKSVILFAVLFGNSARGIQLRSPQVTNWGDWHLWDECPENTFVVGMQLRTHQYQGTWSDDSALNGIKFFCEEMGSKSNKFVVMSGEETYGDYGKEFYCNNGVATGFQLRSEKSQTIFADDTAANNLRLFCNSNSSDLLEGDGLDFGHWTEPQGCFRRQALCGYSSQIDHDLSSGDVTGLNNIKMRCCNVPDPAESCLPEDKWDLLIECDNIDAVTPTTCEYKRKVGISHSAAFSEGMSQLITSYTQLGFTIPEALAQLGFNFGTNINTTTGYDWTSSNSETWSSETTTTINFQVPPGYRTELFQTMGRCGIYSVRAPRVRRVDTDKRTGTKTVSYFSI